VEYYCGIRAYNVNEKMKFHQAILYDYVKNGGNLILQYNTNSDLNMNELAPYSMKLSRERVTMEDAEIRILKPEHPLLNKPNKITTQDFNGWVQERGLYFAGEWDKTNLEALFSCNDVNEPPREGSLLTGTYGKGRYTYTSLAFFRQLPAGVPGAFRLFANLISGGK